MTRLLDVNVLVAVAWPTHTHHELARRWFRDIAGRGWATCPATELGFVRLAANPAVVDPPLLLTEAAELVVRLRAAGEHRFWPDHIGAGDVDWSTATTYRHVPDAHLLALARRHDGRLATLDRRLAARAGPDRVELVS